MEIIELDAPLTMDLHKLKEYDDELGAGDEYRVDRDMNLLLGNSILPVNYFSCIDDLLKQRDERVAVMEGGCGVGLMLRDLKKGTVFMGGDLSLIGLLEGFSPDVQSMLLSLLGQEIPGFGNRIHTTGLTLSRRHVEVAIERNDPFPIDRMVVGPLEHYAKETDHRYDFIYDYLGIAIRSPKQAVEAYSHLMKPEGQGMFRLPILPGLGVDSMVKMIRAQGSQDIDCRPAFINKTLMEAWVRKPA